MSRSIKSQTGLNSIVLNRQDPLHLCSCMSQWCFLQSEWGYVLYRHFALSARSHFHAPWRDKQVLLLLLLLLRSHAAFDLKWSSVGDAGFNMCYWPKHVINRETCGIMVIRFAFFPLIKLEYRKQRPSFYFKLSLFIIIELKSCYKFELDHITLLAKWLMFPLAISLPIRTMTTFYATYEDFLKLSF